MILHVVNLCKSILCRIKLLNLEKNNNMDMFYRSSHTLGKCKNVSVSQRGRESERVLQVRLLVLLSVFIQCSEIVKTAVLVFCSILWKVPRVCSMRHTVQIQ